MNGLTSLAVSKLDVLTGLDEIRICVAYRVNGQELGEFPASPNVLAACEPVYETFPGWQESIDSARNLDDLPQEARDYIRWLEDALEVPADLVGVGPERGATLECTNPFDRARGS